MNENESQAPNEEVLVYLDQLRTSGVTNMFGAAPYLEARFNMNRHEAKQALAYWMRTFGDRHKDA